MSKKIIGTIRLVVPAAKANPSPPIGPALGQRGVNIMEFCKQFNERTKNVKDNLPLPVLVTVYDDRTFSFTVYSPSTTFLIKQYAGSSNIIKATDLLEIAKVKKNDENFRYLSVPKIFSNLCGTTKSMKLSLDNNLDIKV